MANVSISDLKFASSKFCLNYDPKNYLNELVDSELNSIHGGIKPSPSPIPFCPVGPRIKRSPFPCV